MEHKEILKFHCPRYEELPTIPLYKDQVIAYIEEVLGPLNLNRDEKLLTPTMLNNYVKQRVVRPPVGRRYTENHLAYLIVVCLFKQVYSLTEICQMITVQTNLYPIQQAYDFFCVELERHCNTFLEHGKRLNLIRRQRLRLKQKFYVRP